MEVLEDLKLRVIGMEVEKTMKLTQRALDTGYSAEKILTNALIPAMAVVGEQYERGEKYVPEMLLSAHAMKGAIELLRPLLAESGMKPKGRVVIGTVEGDLHDIGQNLVSMMLEGAGFNVSNLGTDTSAGRFVQAIKENEIDLVGMSSMLTTTMVQMPEVIRALDANGLRDKLKVMVGGAPVTQEYADEIGADGYAPNAASAVKLAERLMVKT